MSAAGGVLRQANGEPSTATTPTSINLREGMDTAKSVTLHHTRLRLQSGQRELDHFPRGGEVHTRDPIENATWVED